MAMPGMSGMPGMQMPMMLMPQMQQPFIMPQPQQALTDGQDQMADDYSSESDGDDGKKYNKKVGGALVARVPTNCIRFAEFVGWDSVMDFGIRAKVFLKKQVGQI